MDTDPNAAPAAVDFFDPAIQHCIRESFGYQPVLMSGLVVALGVSVWLIGLRIRGCLPGAAPETENSFARGWAGWLEFALGRLVLTGIVAHACLAMIQIAFTCSQGAGIMRPLECMASGDVYIFCTPLLAACVVYANCTVSCLIGKMKRRAF